MTGRRLHLKTLSAAAVLAIILSGTCESTICHGQTLPIEGELRSWRMGVFFDGGVPPNYSLVNSYVPVSASLQLQMYSLGIEAGKSPWGTMGKGILRGRMEVRAEVIPLWVGHYPAQTVVVRYGDGSRVSSVWKGQNFFGSSITPFLARWNFDTRDSSRYVPWIQLGAGVLWTNHKFPITEWAAPASTFNFTPQVGVGFTVFHNRKRSIDLGIKAVHISNAGLGDSNPGINQAIMGSIGYSWRK